MNQKLKGTEIYIIAETTQLCLWHRACEIRRFNDDRFQRAVSFTIDCNFEV